MHQAIPCQSMLFGTLPRRGEHWRSLPAQGHLPSLLGSGTGCEQGFWIIETSPLSFEPMADLHAFEERFAAGDQYGAVKVLRALAATEPLTDLLEPLGRVATAAGFDDLAKAV